MNQKFVLFFFLRNKDDILYNWKFIKSSQINTMSHKNYYVLNTEHYLRKYKLNVNYYKFMLDKKDYKFILDNKLFSK